MVLGVHAAIGVTVEVASRSSDRAADTLEVEAARQMIRRWLEAAYLPPDLEGTGFEGADRSVLGEPLDEVAFLTLDPVLLRSGTGSPTRIRLRVDRDRGLVAEQEGVDVEGQALTVFPGARGLDVRYQIRLGGEARWFDGWSSRVRLPVAVEVRVLGAPGDSLHDFAAAPLLITLPGNG